MASTTNELLSTPFPAEVTSSNELEQYVTESGYILSQTVSLSNPSPDPPKMGNIKFFLSSELYCRYF